ncbi:MAG: hypothetical protein QF733_00835 [Phycisphaerales bacterium]|jgi:hypothetical protein|nr:hypothetical protein [Phycisphaerales bacterium]
MSRFATTAAAKPTPDVFTAIAGIAVLLMILGALWLVMHNLESSSSGEDRGDGGIFKILD